MALRWFDGFDFALTTRYGLVTGTTALSTAAVRTGNTSFQINTLGNVSKLLDTQTTWIVGFAFIATTNNAGPLKVCQLQDGTTAVLTLQFDTVTNIISVLRGTTVITSFTDTTFVRGNIWNYIEWKTFISDTVGSTEVRLNGVSVCSVSGVDTKNSAGTGANTIYLGLVSSASTYIYFDDFYICDGTGSTHNNFLGEVRVVTSRPEAPGDVTGLTPVGAATNWDCVNDISSDTATHVDSAVAGTYDLYQMQDLGASDNPSQVIAAQVCVVAQKDDTVLRQVAPMIKSGGVEFVGANLTLTQNSYAAVTQLYVVDPADGLSWTKAKITGLQAGVKVTV